MDLPESNLTMAPRGLLRRDPVTGSQELSRVRLGEAWSLEAVVGEQTDRTEVVAHTDLFSGERGRFESVPLKQVAPGRYRLISEPRRAGVYHYQLRISRDGGANWQCERVPYGRVHVEPAAIHGLRMYSLIPRISGCFADWARHLSRIRDLGFNAVHLLPVTTPGGSKSPYAANHLFEIDSAYADPSDSRPPLEQFEGFVHEARRLGLRLCLDLVVNHVAVDGRIARHRPDWVVPDDEEPDGFKRAGFWMGRQWIKWGDLALLDHRHPDPIVREELHNHILQYARYWARYAAETEGMVRLDNTHSTDERFLGRLLNELHETYPRLGVLAELFADPQTAERLVWDQGVHLLLGTLWEMPYAAQTRQYLLELHRAHPKLRYYLPITSPDSGSPAEEYGSDEATGPRYAVAALMGTGCTGSVQGVEWGVREKISFIGLPGAPPEGFGRQHDRTLQTINRLLATEPAFAEAGNLRFVDGNHPAVVAALRDDPKTRKPRFLIVANFDVHGSQTLSLQDTPLLRGKLWVDLMADQEPAPSPVAPLIQLEPCGVRVYRIQEA